jgi:hypothetical protein
VGHEKEALKRLLSLVDLPFEEYARRVIPLRDIRRHAIWRETNPEQFEALLNQP